MVLDRTFIDRQRFGPSELLYDEKSRSGAVQSAPLQHLLQNLLVAVQRTLCGQHEVTGQRGRGRREEAVTARRKTKEICLPVNHKCMKLNHSFASFKPRQFLVK